MDLGRDDLVRFGGYDFSSLGDTWTWNGVTWTQENPPSSPSPRCGHGMTFHEASQQVVLFGGAAYYRDTWTRKGVTWTRQ